MKTSALVPDAGRSDQECRLFRWFPALLALAACGGEPTRGSDDGVAPHDATGVDSSADATHDTHEVAPVDTATPDSVAPDMVTPDTLTTDSIAPAETDTSGDTSVTPDADDDADVTDASDVGVVCGNGDIGSLCTLFGYVPPCYEGRCNTLGTCILTPVAACCRSDADCPPDEAATACEASRCITGVCTLSRVPGCCADDPTGCALGVCDTLAGRCAACPAMACPEQPPIFVAHFDSGAWPLSVTDYQAADQVGWQVDKRRWVMGGAAGYLGNVRCATYYGGALDAACQPSTDGEQDSGRVQVVTRTSFINLPAGTPSVATFWLWIDVEPSLGRGLAEPDLLRVSVEPASGAPAWLAATSLDVGKSTGGVWRPMVVDLAPWVGQTLRLAFEFDSYDGENNRHEGVWIDELVVARACTDGGCCENDLDCPSAGCHVGRCVPSSSGTGGHCLDGPVTPNLACTVCIADSCCDDGDPCTADTCGDGRCEHTTFCCLERDVYVHDVASEGIAGLLVADDDASDGVTWQLVDGALAFVDILSGTYASDPPGKPVSGSISTPSFSLPTTGRAVGLDVTLRLSTEWDLWTGATFGNPAGLDRLTIVVLDQALVTPLWTSDAIAGSTSGESLSLRLDLAPWRGRTIQIRITFTSGDADQNEFTGPRISALSAGVRCTGP